MIPPQVLASRLSFSPTQVLGSTVIGGLGEAILQGMLLSELVSFCEKPTKNRLLRLTVYWVNAIALLQTCITGHNWWNQLVENFSSESILSGFDWETQIQPVVTCLMSGPVHGYFIYRCWMSTNRNWPVTIALVSVATLSVISAVLTTICTFVLSANHFIATDLSRNLSPTFDIWLISSSVLDMSITAILLNYLIRSRQQTHSRYLNTLIDRLIVLAWQSACPPCICAISMCIIFGNATLQGTITYWTLCPGAMLGKLYCISLMNTINSRESLVQHLDVTDPHAPTTIPGVVFDLRTGFDKPESVGWSTTQTTEHVQVLGSRSSTPKPVATDLES